MGSRKAIRNLPFAVLIMAAFAASLVGPIDAQAETSVSGDSTHDSPLILDPVSEPTDPQVKTINAYNGQTIMYIQRMPVTKLVTRITLGDLAEAPTCKGAAVYNLFISQQPTGRAVGGTANWEAKSLAPQSLPKELGKVTWRIPPTILNKGSSYSIVLENGYSDCQTPTIRTWAHNDQQVNGGPAGCDAIEAQYRAYRMWHKQGEGDVVACPYGQAPSGFDPSMPTGWLRIGYYVSAYVETPSGAKGGPSPSCSWAEYGTKSLYWREDPSSPGWNQYVCEWPQFTDPGVEVEDGWYYAWGADSLPGGLRDAYLKAWAEEEDVAAYYKPMVYFDTSESWRPLDLDRMFQEKYLLGGTEEVPRHNACTEGVAESPVFIGAGCAGIAAPEELMGEGHNTAEAQLDIQGFGLNEAIEDYATPGCSIEVELWDCAANDSAIYWRVTPVDPVGPPTEDDPYKYVQFWMFYRVNSFSDAIDDPVSRHEGDWESVAVAPSRARPGAFDFASFSQHGHWYSYLRENLSCWIYSGTHSCGTESLKSTGRPLEVFVANGSHANYGVRCSEVVEFLSCGQNASSVPERGHDGAYGWTHNATAVPSTTGLKALPTEGSTWTYWLGFWGATESSPQSPGWQPMFNQSWERCADDDEGCPMPETSSRRAVTPGSERVAVGRMIRGPFPKACENWFGGDVTAVLCARGTLASSVEVARLGAKGTGEVKVLRQGGDRRQRNVAQELDQVDTAPGLSQAVGSPMLPGDKLRIVAPRQQRWILLVRSMIRDQLVEARFADLRSGRARLDALDDMPVLRQRGRTLTPVAIRARPLGATELARPDQPR